MLSVEEAANHFGLRPDTVRRKIRSGEIDAIQIGRTYPKGSTSPRSTRSCSCTPASR